MEWSTGYAGQLQGYVEESCRREETFHFLQFEFLQRANLVHLQNKLARLKSDMRQSQICSEDMMQELQGTFHAYATAVHDYSALHAHSAILKPERRSRSMRLERHFPSLGSLPGRPFDSHYARLETHSPSGGVATDTVRTLLRAHLPLTLAYSSAEKTERRHEYESGRPPLDVSDFVDRIARFVVAFASGAFLLVPMVVMLLYPRQYTGLVTVCVAVLLFSISVAFGVRATNVETMVATATYAAVLVVFVGANQGSQP